VLAWKEEVVHSKKEALEERLEKEQNLRQLMADEGDKPLDQRADDEKQREIDELTEENRGLRKTLAELRKKKVDDFPDGNAMRRKAGLLLVRLIISC
jgi:hypothetical protein